MYKSKKMIIALLSLSLLSGCSAADNTKKSITENTGEKIVENIKLTASNAQSSSAYLQKLSEADGIDFSNVSYIASEKEKDEKLENALIKLYNLKHGEDKFKYYYNKIDLNGDNTPEIFVYLVGSLFCGTGGCSAAIFKVEGEEYKLVSKFTLVNNPIVISNNKTNGWNDIITYVSGGGADSGYVELKFDGNKYPSNPSTQPNVKSSTKVNGTAIISDDISKVEGIEFK
jgi:hypothetical protein